MLPQLTAGAVTRILNGEDVSKAVIQILDRKKIPGAVDERYCFRISDGVTSSPFALLGPQLNYLVSNKGLEKFTIVQIEKYACQKVFKDWKMIILLNLTVLAPGNMVNKKIGNPVSSNIAGEVTTLAANSVANTYYAKQIPAYALYSSMLNGYPVLYTRFLYSMFPEVASGAVTRILNGEIVENAVIQILECIKFHKGGNVYRYPLVISDGVTGYRFVLLAPQLYHLATNKDLEKFTIVRVEKYSCLKKSTDEKVIMLLDLTVLVPGKEVNKVLGNPVGFSSGATAADSTTITVPVKSVAKMGCSNNAVAACKSLEIPLLQLTTGAINRILDGEDVANAIFQILGYKIIPGAGNDRYRLLISDGITDFPYALLGNQFNHMVVNKELEKYTIVRVGKCVCHQVQTDRKVIVLFNLTALVPGDKVNGRLGNLVDLCTRGRDSSYVPVVNNVAETCPLKPSCSSSS